MTEIFEKLQILNTIKGKLIILFSSLILVTTCINLLLINLYVNNYHNAPQPVDTVIIKPGPFDTSYFTIIRDKIAADRENLRVTKDCRRS